MAKTIKLSSVQLRRLVSETLSEDNEPFPGFFDDEKEEEAPPHEEDEKDSGFFSDEKISPVRREEAKRNLGRNIIKEAFQSITQEELQAWKKGDYSGFGKDEKLHEESDGPMTSDEIYGHSQPSSEALGMITDITNAVQDAYHSLKRGINKIESQLDKSGHAAHDDLQACLTDLMNTTNTLGDIKKKISPV